MDLTLWLSNKISRPTKEVICLKEFLQFMINRLTVGFVRYGPANKNQKFMTSMTMEFKAYKKKGNMEHLINIANYCYLESMEPENPKFHFDNSVDSIMRGKIK